MIIFHYLIKFLYIELIPNFHSKENSELTDLLRRALARQMIIFHYLIKFLYIELSLLLYVRENSD